MTSVKNDAPASAFTPAPNTGLAAAKTSKQGYRLVLYPQAQTKVMAAQVAAEPALKENRQNLSTSTAPSAPDLSQLRSETSLKASESVRAALSKTNSPLLSASSTTVSVSDQPSTAPSAPGIALPPMAEVRSKVASGSQEILKRFDQLLASSKLDIRLVVGAIQKNRISKEELLKWALERNVDPELIKALAEYQAITVGDFQTWNKQYSQQHPMTSKSSEATNKTAKATVTVPPQTFTAPSAPHSFLPPMAEASSKKTAAVASASSSSVSTTRTSVGSVASVGKPHAETLDDTTIFNSELNMYACVVGKGMILAQKIIEKLRNPSSHPNFYCDKNTKVWELSYEEWDELCRIEQQKCRELLRQQGKI